MRDAVLVVLLLGGTTYLLKAAGPIALGNRRLPTRVERLVELVPAPLLGALVAVSFLVEDGGLVVDARAGGVLAAAVVLWRGGGFVTTVLVAAAVTAGLRLVGLG